MHALSTALLLASLGAGTLAASYHGLFFTSSDSSCLLIGAPILPNDGTKGQFSSSVAAIKPQLVDCTRKFLKQPQVQVRKRKRREKKRGMRMLCRNRLG